jgi:hypothetical protein
MIRTTTAVVKKPTDARKSRSRRDSGNLLLYTSLSLLCETITARPPRIKATKIGRVQKLRVRNMASLSLNR